MNKNITNFINFCKKFKLIFNKKRVFSESASLTYVTILGFIPFSFFIILLIPEFASENMENHFNKILLQTFLPEQAELISKHFASLLNQKISFNIVNFLMLLITSFSLFKVITNTFDNILNVHESAKKSFMENFIKFLGMIVFGFLIIVILFSAMSLPIIYNIFDLPALSRYSNVIIPILMIFIIFQLVYLFIPTVDVSKIAVLKSAFYTTIIWVSAKAMFNYYITYLTNLKVLYGVLASIPIFLIWIFLNWSILLSGVVFVSIYEKRYKYDEKNNKNNTLKVTLELKGEKLPDPNKIKHISKSDLRNILKEVLSDEKET